MEKDKTKTTFSRRSFLKATGATSAVLGLGGLGFFGYQAGQDPSSYTGWKTFEGGDQNFPRHRFVVDKPPHEKVGPTRRVDPRSEIVFSRLPTLLLHWQKNPTPESLPQYLQDYYREHPEDLELDLYNVRELRPKLMADQQKYGRAFILAEAWSEAMGAVTPPQITEPPETADFPPRRSYFREEVPRPYKLKSPEKTSRLIKKIAHELGATLVGIARLNPDWVFQYPIPGRGLDPSRPLEIPSHWEYAIVVGTPMSWDPLYANPNYGTSEDAYSISRIIAYRLAAFIKKLGYAARPHTPGYSYDLMVPPIMIDAGLGEQARSSIVITPELGPNFRAAVVTTNIPLKPDKPIKFGVESFCKTCKICAEQCPSGAITKGDKVVVRGYRKWQLHAAKCYNFWNSNLGNMGCRICISVCPYTRKANWLHRAALHLSSNDPTGLTHGALTKLQKIFYPGPNPQDYYIPSLGGKNASYRRPPWWLRTEDFIEFE